MPVYEYQCLECRAHFERVESIGEHGKPAPRCPKCKSARVEQLLAQFFALTGKKS